MLLYAFFRWLYRFARIGFDRPDARVRWDRAPVPVDQTTKPASQRHGQIKGI